MPSSFRWVHLLYFLFGTVGDIFFFFVGVVVWDLGWLYYDGFLIFASDFCLLQLCDVT